MTEVDAYNEALKSGQYQKPGGLLGKYDNVRRFWEDEQLGLYLRPYLEKLVDQKKGRGEGLRVLDLGCGSGDGFEFLTSIHKSGAAVSQHDIRVVEPAMLEHYRGIDINDGLLDQARASYGDMQNMDFLCSDYNDFDYAAENDCDLYLANYGTLSHNQDEQTVDLVASIARHGENGAIIAIDWLGRYSYEWQTLWTNNLEENQWMDYAISYIYADGAKKEQGLTCFPLRIIGRQEVQHIYQQAKKKAGGAIALRKLADRSSFVGRHMDTAQYNTHAQPLRGLINLLFEPNLCSNLDELLIRYVPREGFDEVNSYHHRLTMWWNYLILYTRALLEEKPLPELPDRVPASVRKTLNTMKKVVKAAAGVRTGTPRASLVEPQLAYCLRELEMGLQDGLGCGHGLVAIFEVVK